MSLRLCVSWSESSGGDHVRIIPCLMVDVTDFPGEPLPHEHKKKSKKRKERGKVDLWKAEVSLVELVYKNSQDRTGRQGAGSTS